MKRLILLILIIAAFLASPKVLQAQEEWSTNDTIKVLDNYGNPGDTVVVDLHIANLTLSVAAYGARIVYDTAVLRALRVDRFGRGSTLEATSADTSRPGILNIIGYTMFPLDNFIPRGSGVVLRMTFYVRPSAAFGATSLQLIDDTEPPIEGVNSLADSTGLRLVHPVLVNGTVSVTGGGFNSPPVLGSIGPQEIAEGQTLQFLVNAHDPDGDPVTLTAENRPENSSFNSVQPDSAVSQLFTFSPSFEQGPDTFFVTFVAADNHNNVTRLTVQIVVLDQPNDRMIVDSGQGGVPGASGRAVDVNLFNSKPIFGIQFNYHYDETQIEVVDVVQTERSLGLGFWYSFPEPGEIIVLIFSPGLDRIEQGTGPIVRFFTDVGDATLFGRTPVVLDSAIEVIDSIGTSRRLVTENGYFTVDRFGDANLDENVNVGDCITIVAFIIERIILNIRQFDAGDINRDGRVNVADLQNVIDRILMIPLTPGPLPPDGPVVAELSPEISQVGDLITVDLMADVTTEAAAVQYKLDFNPEHLEPLSVDAGEMVSGFTFDKQISSDRISGVIYNLANTDGSTFGPAYGSLTSFTFRLRTGNFDPRDLAITEFAIATLGAALIPSEVRSQLPTDYVLAQNYPNPFNASTNISFDLPSGADVRLSVYDVLGREVATLIDGPLAAGNHVVTWNGRTDRGEEVSTGVFFYRLRSSEFDETKKMLMIK
jgi:hypothetical protein